MTDEQNPQSADDTETADAPSAERVAATEQAATGGPPLAGPADVVEGRINVEAAHQASDDPEPQDIEAASTGLVGGGPEVGDTPAPPTPANPSPGVSTPQNDDRTHLNLPADEQPAQGQPDSVTEGLGATADAEASAEAAAAESNPAADEPAVVDEAAPDEPAQDEVVEPADDDQAE